VAEKRDRGVWGLAKDAVSYGAEKATNVLLGPGEDLNPTIGDLTKGMPITPYTAPIRNGRI
jgi:hypothetical protein